MTCRCERSERTLRQAQANLREAISRLVGDCFVGLGLDTPFGYSTNSPPRNNMKKYMNETPPVSIALEKLGIPHRVFRHASSVTSLEQAARERGQKPGQVVRSILFRIAENEFVMVLVAGPAQISWKALRKVLGRSRISMATEDEVLAVTGYHIGTVGPFGTSRQLKVLIEAGVLSEEEISIGSGVRNTAVMLRSADLRRGLENAEVVSLIE